MRKRFSLHWKRSVQPRKQRKFRFNAPLHIRKQFMSAHLSKELRKKHGMRAIPLRKGDKVKVMRGQSKGKTGKVDHLNLLKEKVYVTGIDIQKKEGSKVLLPLAPSNLLIEELNLEDKKRRETLKQK